MNITPTTKDESGNASAEMHHMERIFTSNTLHNSNT